MTPPALNFPPHLVGPTLIGQGGYGWVFHAKWEGEPSVLARGTPVAVKVFMKSDDRSIRRLVRRKDFYLKEARHPHLVTIYEVTAPPDWEFAYLVMEYMPGGTLRERLEDFRSPRAAVALVKLLIKGVAHLHVSEFVHRDLKPENVLFSAMDLKPDEITRGFFTVKIADFDLVREAQTPGSTSRPIGTANYMSPEQAESVSSVVSYPTDVYALGVMLYEILTGRRPRFGDDCRPSRYNRAVRGNLDQIVLGCLQKDPTRRYSITQLQSAIGEFVADCVSAKKFPSPPIIPSAGYPRFVRGRINLDVVLLFGGDATHRYTYPDGIETTSSLDDVHEVPNVLLDATEDWLRWREADAARRGAPFENRRQPRVLHVGPSRLTEGRHELLYPLALRIGVTDYYTTQCTNFAVNQLLPDRSTIRESYGGAHNDFENSLLANPLATNFSVVTCGGGEKYIFMTQRGRHVGGNVEFDEHNRVPSVSGTGHPVHDHDPVTGHFCPFQAGVREAREEVLGDYPLRPEELTYFGFARTGMMMFPFLFGEIRLHEMTAQQFHDQRILHRNDVFAKEGRPFTIEAVTEWIKELYHRYDSSGVLLSRPSHTGIFSLYQSLIYEYPEEIGRINSLLSE